MFTTCFKFLYRINTYLLKLLQFDKNRQYLGEHEFAEPC